MQLAGLLPMLILRTYKQKYQLLRVYVPNLKNSNNEHIQIWNDEQNVLSLDDIQSKNRLINIVEITGLKFTNQSFHLEYLIRQIMVFKEKKTFNKCLISLDNSTYKKINEDLESRIDYLDRIDKKEIAQVLKIKEELLRKDLEKLDPSYVENKPIPWNKIALWAGTITGICACFAALLLLDNL